MTALTLTSSIGLYCETFLIIHESKTETKKLQDWIIANQEVKIIAIHGFTDEDGTSGFNDTLSKKRVNSLPVNALKLMKVNQNLDLSQ